MSTKRMTFIGVAVVAIAASLLGAYRLGERQASDASTHAPAQATQATQAAQAAHDAVSTTTDRKILYWHDPMVPGQRFDKPGKSPYMDMPLVPVYADETQGGGVAVSPGMTQNLGLRTAIVRRGPVQSGIDLQGVVAQNERATVVVQSRAAGYVEKLYVRAPLDAVAKGQPLATLYVPEWAGALSEYAALRRANIDASIVEAARDRLKLLSVPDDAVARAERDGTIESRYTLTAPIGGVVAELGAREGVQAQPGMMLFRIVDLSTVWVEANVPESQAGMVRTGMHAEARTEAYPDRAFAGKVTAILPQVDPSTRTLRARIELANPGLVLKPGMFVRVGVHGSDARQALVVPQEAIIATGKRNVLIVVNNEGRFEPRDVTLGRAVGSDVEVTAGVAEGQRVVTSGQFLIDSEASLKSALPRLEAAATTPAPATAIYRAEGLIEAIDQGGVTISHGPVAALRWPAMTMQFKAPAGGLPAGVKAGDRVAFEFVQGPEGYALTMIVPARGGKS